MNGYDEGPLYYALGLNHGDKHPHWNLVMYILDNNNNGGDISNMRKCEVVERAFHYIRIDIIMKYFGNNVAIMKSILEHYDNILYENRFKDEYNKLLRHGLMTVHQLPYINYVDYAKLFSKDFELLSTIIRNLAKYATFEKQPWSFKDAQTAANIFTILSFCHIDTLSYILHNDECNIYNDKFIHECISHHYYRCSDNMYNIEYILSHISDKTTQQYYLQRLELACVKKDFDEITHYISKLQIPNVMEQLDIIIRDTVLRLRYWDVIAHFSHQIHIRTLEK